MVPRALTVGLFAIFQYELTYFTNNFPRGKLLCPFKSEVQGLWTAKNFGMWAPLSTQVRPTVYQPISVTLQN